MKSLRQIGSIAFVIGLFVAIFGGIPWHVIVADEPPVPVWLTAAIFLLLGGIFLVLLTVAFEQGMKRKPETEALPDDAETVILISNSDTVPGRDAREILGVVQGHTVFAIWLGKDLSALIRLILGGELTEYTDMMGKARRVATGRMIEEAEELGADAIVNLRYMTTSVVGSAAELLAYGTAVKLNR